MIASDRHCGTCGNAYLLKEFRGAEVYVCQGCKTVTVSKGDFKRLLGGSPPATPAPAPMAVGRENSMDLGDTSGAFGKSEPELGFLRTEETEEFPGGPEYGTMAPTEIAESGPRMDDDAYAAELTEHARPYVEDSSAYAIQDEDELDDVTFEAELAAYRSRRQRSVLIAGIAMVALLGLVGLAAVGAGAAGLFAASSTDEPANATTEQPEVAPEDPAPAPEPTTEPATPEPAEPEPAKPEPVKPEPAKPSPAPAAPAPAPASGVGALVRQGWSAFDQSPADAEGFFRKALDQQSGHADANYGYGYALLKQGRATEATPYLCKAQQTGDAEISRDIRALLTHNGLSCE